MSLWADDQWWKEMHAPRHPAPPVSEGDALAKAFADYESTREDVARRTDPMRANSLLLAGAGLANAVKDHLGQLQVQAPVGEGLENGVSDGEREAIINELHAVEGMLGLSHYRGEKLTADEMNQGRTALESARECIAAGYRKAPVVNVEDVAYIHPQLADAWDEGYRAGKSACMKPVTWDNPYMPTIGGGL